MAPNRSIAFMCGLSMLQASSAWLPLTAPRVSTAGTSASGAAAAATAHPRLFREAQLQSTLLRASLEEGSGGVDRPDLASMKRAFEGTMDNKLVMEYVMVRFKYLLRYHYIHVEHMFQGFTCTCCTAVQQALFLKEHTYTKGMREWTAGVRACPPRAAGSRGRLLIGGSFGATKESRALS